MEIQTFLPGSRGPVQFKLFYEFEGLTLILSLIEPVFGAQRLFLRKQADDTGLNQWEKNAVREHGHQESLEGERRCFQTNCLKKAKRLISRAGMRKPFNFSSNFLNRI
ncbi:hypothetical protein NITGR_270020 [Nitrospina gracilis 3/211]|uniref:Uncharacterized protein n=1 Tax=Nitrospina gracilis (strain 3/211) TaxID=1266370 RepID=M1YYC5_NITG3|nr:hypothetical protein NITGR_270020 [Nitrospina gracilis 3/211]